MVWYHWPRDQTLAGEQLDDGRTDRSEMQSAPPLYTLTKVLRQRPHVRAPAWHLVLEQSNGETRREGRKQGHVRAETADNDGKGTSVSTAGRAAAAAGLVQ
jgi:hypothetical protein